MPDPFQPALLALADGTVVRGVAFGARGTSGGELCFNTSISGYQEILTDPSYHGQMMVMTYPHIGNYGTFADADEADAPHVAALIVRDYTEHYSNALAETSLHDYMMRHGLVGIAGVDTRALVLHVRDAGVMNAVVSTEITDEAELVRMAQNWPSMDGLELASKVTVETAFDYATHAGGPKIAVYDFGVKRSILRHFDRLGANVRVFPAGTPLSDVLGWDPDGLFFSNGPGDPRAMPEAIENAKGALGSGLPTFGICLGHQLLALAAGFDVFKMKVGHRGANHPVKNLARRHVEVTTQNHGFAVDPGSVDASIAEVSHTNLNDRTVEGLRFIGKPAFCVQYHPEACPGPHDSHYLFDDFLNLIRTHAPVAAV
ncbi:MAG: glutamine-hydrolyzing carbamoyl-phosphate synthase small subunit [Bacteroidetes bacterium]|nr:glutamine-hydrolyzing carbamoyl-phosphate synthase small subunit [Bacteroidota bacterium]